MKIITLNDLSKAISNRMDVDEGKANRTAEFILDLFGYDDRIIDNYLNPEYNGWTGKEGAQRENNSSPYQKESGRNNKRIRSIPGRFSDTGGKSHVLSRLQD